MLGRVGSGRLKNGPEGQRWRAAGAPCPSASTTLPRPRICRLPGAAGSENVCFKGLLRPRPPVTQREQTQLQPSTQCMFPITFSDVWWSICAQFSSPLPCLTCLCLTRRKPTHVQTAESQTGKSYIYTWRISEIILPFPLFSRYLQLLGQHNFTQENCCNYYNTKRVHEGKPITILHIYRLP